MGNGIRKGVFRTIEKKIRAEAALQLSKGLNSEVHKEEKT